MYRNKWSIIGLLAVGTAGLVMAAGFARAAGPGGGSKGASGGSKGASGGSRSTGGASAASRGSSGFGGTSGAASSRAFSTSTPSSARPAVRPVTPSAAPAARPAAVGGAAAGNPAWKHSGYYDRHHRHHNFFLFGYYPWGVYDPWFYSSFYYFPRDYYWSDYYHPVHTYEVPASANVYASAAAPLPENAQEQPPMPLVEDNAVLIGVRVPAGAQIWFDGETTNQTGSFREFISPALKPGVTYTYVIKARWLANGKEVIRTRELNVFAGDRVLVNLINGARD